MEQELSQDQIEYLKRKERIVNNFIDSTVINFANKIYSTYPYSLEYSDVSSYREHFKVVFNIPAYPITENEWDVIIEKINKKLSEYVEQLIKEDEEIRSDLSSNKQKISENNDTEKTNNENDSNNIAESHSDKTLNDDLSMMFANEIKMEVVFDLTEKYNNGIEFEPISVEYLKSQYNINDNIAQKLETEINEMLKNYIEAKENSEENDQPYILDGFEEENGELTNGQELGKQVVKEISDTVLLDKTERTINSQERDLQNTKEK